MKNTRKEILLWTAIIMYVGIIYSTLALVSAGRKLLVEQFGPDVFDVVYWIFAAAGAALFFVIWVKLRGRTRIRALAILGILTIVYWYSLSRLSYAVERIHFLQYGSLGILLFLALRRRTGHRAAVMLSVAVSFWVGLGDETLQWYLSERVGEFRDATTNLFSSALGVFAVSSILPLKDDHSPAPRNRWLLLFATLLSIATVALFLKTVHGFGHVIENKSVGRFYSAFPERTLREINRSGAVTGKRHTRIYRNEAMRHLYQREFYFVNKFKGADGTYYRRLDVSWFENKILRTYYSRFLKEHGKESAVAVLGAQKGEIVYQSTNSVLWRDSVRSYVENIVSESDFIYESRVKNTVITTFDQEDLAFYSLLAAGFVVWLFSAYHNTFGPKRKGHQNEPRTTA